MIINVSSHRKCIVKIDTAFGYYIGMVLQCKKKKHYCNLMVLINELYYLYATLLYKLNI